MAHKLNPEQDESGAEQETPELAVPFTEGGRETRMSMRLKQATIKAESEEAEDEVVDDLGADENDQDDDDDDDDDEDAEVCSRRHLRMHAGCWSLETPLL